MSERRTIKEWSDVFGIDIVNPKGFNAKSHNVALTKEEFVRGLLDSEVVIRRNFFDMLGDKKLERLVGEGV